MADSGTSVESVSLVTLPDELLGWVLEFLNVREIRALDQTCREVRGRVKDLVVRVCTAIRLLPCQRAEIRGEMVGVREILWFPHVREIVGSCYIRNVEDLRLLAKVPRALNMSLVCRSSLVLKLGNFLRVRGLQYPESVISVNIMYNKNSEYSFTEVCRYETGHLHLTIVADQKLPIKTIRDLPFSSLQLSLWNFPYSEEEGTAKLQTLLQDLGIHRKKIERLVVREWPWSIPSRFFPHLRTIRFLEFHLHTNLDTLFSEPITSVTCLENAHFSVMAHRLVFKEDIKRSLETFSLTLDLRYPNLQTGDLTLDVQIGTLETPTPGTRGLVDDWKRDMSSKYPRLIVHIKYIRASRVER